MPVKVTKKRKVRHMRGQRWHGWGSKKKHRGKGSKGGRGRAGYHKHKFSYVNTYDPEFYGYKGFVPPTKVGEKIKVINLDALQKMADENKTTEFDLTKMGYTKLLGRGEIRTMLTVKVDDYSKSAKEKIEKAGGKIISEKTMFEESSKENEKQK